MVAKPWTPPIKLSVLLKKPFLTGGIGLTLGLSLWKLAVPDMTELWGMATWGAIALGTGVWWLSRRDEPLMSSLSELPVTISRETVEAALTALQQSIEQLAIAVTETAPQSQNYVDAIAHFRQQVQNLSQELDRRHLYCAVVGAKGVGKTTLVAHLSSYFLTQDPNTDAIADPSNPIISFIDTDAVLTASTPEETGTMIPATPVNPIDAIPALGQADLVIFVTEGDMTASELQVVKALVDQRFEVVVAFNKRDRHVPEQRETILHHLQGRISPYLEQSAVITTAAIATPIKVRQHQPDGTIQERVDQTPAHVADLTDRVEQVIHQDVERLVLSSTLRQVHRCQQAVQQQWNQLRRDRARPVLEKYQWLSAATAFANPLPTFDVVATSAINAQLMADLGQLYDQPFSLKQAKTATVTLAELMVKLGLVELTTQAIAPLLKTHTLTFAAGGVVQGISAAYLTRVAGLSVIQYLEEQGLTTGCEGDRAATSWNLERLGQIVQQVFQTYQRGDFLQTLVDQGIKRFAAVVAAAGDAAATEGVR